MEILSYNKEYEASLKSIETENFIDKVFYRPIGFFMAKSLRNTGITPNMVTIISIFIGAAAGPLFYYNDLLLNLTGILCLVTANILDCVDGQLARLTGIKSKIGRILDGLAGDIWFTLIYVFLALRLKAEFGTGLFFIPAVLAGVSHQVQANITDYYKTLHLFFLSKEKGREFQSGEEVKKQYRKIKNGIEKVLFFFYMFYTSLQEKTTPQLQKMLFCFKNIYGEDIPENIRLRFRLQSKKIMTQFVDLMTFNGRTIVLFIVVLTGHVWFYFIYEIVVLNIVLALSVSKHERICSSFIKE